MRPQPFAVPERNRRRRAVRVFDAHDAGFHAPDLPRVRAEQKDIAGHALDREVFVERADDVALGFERRRCSWRYPGIAPPLVIAAMRAPRRARSRPLTRS